MQPKCIEAVSAAAGRPVTKAEADGLEERLRGNLRSLARQDREAFLAMPVTERLKQAAQMSAKQLVGEAASAKGRLLLAIDKHDKIDRYIADAKARGLTGMDAIDRTLMTKADLKGHFTSVESQIRAIHADGMRQLWDTFEATEPRIFGMFRNPAAVRLLVKEMSGEKTGSDVARKGAEAWGKVSEAMRQRFNAAGGEVRKLDNYRMPQSWDQMRAANVKADEFVRDMLPLVDRNHYVNESGRLFNDAEMADFLTHAHETISSGGLNKVEPGTMTGSRMSMVANRGNEARQLHFKDADGYLLAQNKYGSSTIEQALASHVHRLARDTALVETFGPNPEHALGYFMDREAKSAVKEDPTLVGKVKAWMTHIDNAYAYLAGLRDPIANPTFAKIATGARQYMMATRLLSSPITAVSDEAFLHLTGRFNGISPLKTMRAELAAYNPLNRSEKRALQGAGIGIESWSSEMNRWGDDNLGRGWTAKLAQQSLRMAGLDALDSTRRRATGGPILNAVGNLSREHETLASLNPRDRLLLENKGITERDWQVIRAAETTDIGGGMNNFLHPDAIMRVPDEAIAGIRNDAGERMGDVFTRDPSQNAQRTRYEVVTKLLARALDEGNMSVPAPGARQHMIMSGGRPPGDVGGELWKALMLFKSFALSTFQRHFLERGLGAETVGGRISYVSSLIAMTTIAGAAAQSINNVLSGKDPQKYWNAPKGELIKNYFQAFLKGGSLGIYGDFLFSSVDKNGMNDLFGELAGPELGLVQQAMNVGEGPLVKEALGKDFNTGTASANALKLAKGLTPFTGLWYAKAALDHMIWNKLTDYFAPGYLDRIQARSERDFGERYWWAPRQDIQQARAPNVARIAGQ